ncbi:DinB family protein [Actinokineospora auranticolor]|uniref:Uncharacterized protein DUF664 n=1 Tax=Actinokineospora auranticolor TaxID=155976 RepID=A0A2S6H0R4_9PSEU|nr:DinB family protein [Actinokineospora auranticolor]PPK71058.1 uncharacterized protein DUF664 [Actinokineospora auranticolor]
MNETKAHLQRYLQDGRDALLWKLDGLSEYDVRRPMTATGTNLLGLVKHVAACESAYFGATFGRPFDGPAWLTEEYEDNADMWATPDETRADIVGLYKAVTAHSDVTIATNDLDTLGRVPHWSPDRAETSLHRVLVHMIVDTQRHAGHADILRETIDGAVGLQVDRDNMPGGDPDWWRDYRDRLEHAAREADARARRAG